MPGSSASPSTSSSLTRGSKLNREVLTATGKVCETLPIWTSRLGCASNPTETSISVDILSPFLWFCAALMSVKTLMTTRECEISYHEIWLKPEHLPYLFMFSLHCRCNFSLYSHAKSADNGLGRDITRQVGAAGCSKPNICGEHTPVALAYDVPRCVSWQGFPQWISLRDIVFSTALYWWS
jgi:hypothetical protein